MDELSFKEAMLADYILKVQNWPREQLLHELLDVKLQLLEKSSGDEIILELDEQRTE